MRESSLGCEQIARRNERLISEELTKRFHFGGRPVGDVGQGAFDGFLAVAPAFAQQDGRRRIPVRDGFDIHGVRSAQTATEYKHQILDYMATFWTDPEPIANLFSGFAVMANIIMLGAVAKITKLVTANSMEKAIVEGLPENAREVNVNAFRKGLKLA